MEAVLTKSPVSVIEFVSNFINSTIDKIAPGEKIDRTDLRLPCIQESKARSVSIDPSDIVLLIGIVIRSRNDVKISKGKLGGSFKI